MKTTDPCENNFLLQHWIKAFRIGLMEIVVSTNNGVEHQNKDFKYEYLKRFKDNTLGGMFTVLIEHFFPDKWKR